MKSPLSRFASVCLSVIALQMPSGHSRLEAAPIHDAAKKGDLEVVLSLLKEGVDVNLRDGTGDTPLMHASLEGQTGVVEVLLKNGASVHEKE